MKIALYGIGGLYNYGCEAIVRGTVILIRRVLPSAEILYYSPRAEYDARSIADLGIEIIQLNAGHRSVPLRALNKAATCLCLPFDSTHEDYDAVLDNSDLLVSIGGDIYTIPVHLRERIRYPYFNKLVKMGELAKGRDIPEVVIGASVGPFGSYKPAVDYYADHLRGVDLICCRERYSVEYLASIGIGNNACLMPDPAFFVTDGHEGDGHWLSAKYLGVNLSPLSLRELYGRYSNEDVSCLVALICRLMDETGLPTLLIPHVLAPDDGDNDLVFLRRLHASMDDAHRRCAEVVEPTSFLDVKHYLRRCRLVVAARMHCAVNAMCEGVPTILLSYSQKAVGMCEFVYGSDQWVAPLDLAEQELPGRLAELEVEADSVHEQLARRVAEVREGLEFDGGFKRLGEVLAQLDNG